MKTLLLENVHPAAAGGAGAPDGHGRPRRNRPHTLCGNFFRHPGFHGESAPICAQSQRRNNPCRRKRFLLLRRSVRSC